MIPQTFTVTSEHIRFYFLVFLLYTFSCCFPAVQIKLTHVGFRAHVKIASRIVSYRTRPQRGGGKNEIPKSTYMSFHNVVRCLDRQVTQITVLITTTRLLRATVERCCNSGQHNHETNRAAPLMSKRTIRIADEGGWGGVGGATAALGGAYVCGAAPVQQLSRSLTRTAKGKGSPYSIAARKVLELIPVLGSQPAGDVSHNPGGRLPLLSARPAVTPVTLNMAATNFVAW